jgi:adenosine deaminase
VTVRELGALPKGHLHLHLEGAMRPTTLVELARTYGIEVPVTRGFGSFSAFAGLYVAACDVLRSWDDLRRVTREVVADAAADGAVWVEPALYPRHHVERLGPVEEVVDVVLDAGVQAAREHGIGFGLMLAADRTREPSDSVSLAELAATRVGQGVVSFGLANDEGPFPPEPFARAFAIAREAGLLSAPHAGELAGPASVLGAIDALGAQRIAHGIRAVEDPDLVKRLAEEGVTLDVCPTSNVLLAVVPDVAGHPLPRLLEAGVRCTINADDPLLFGPGLLQEYALCRDELGLTDEQLAFVARCSVEDSAAPADLVARAVQGIEDWLTG